MVSGQSGSKNMEKIKVVKFIPVNFKCSPSYMTFAVNLPVETNVIKHLSLQMDSQISWNPHTNYLLHYQSSVCLIMIRLSHVLNIQTLGTL